MRGQKKKAYPEVVSLGLYDSLALASLLEKHLTNPLAVSGYPEPDDHRERLVSLAARLSDSLEAAGLAFSGEYVYSSPGRD